MDQNMETKGLGTDIKKITAATGLDKLAKRNIIHDNKAANLKSGLQLHINGL